MIKWDFVIWRGKMIRHIFGYVLHMSDFFGLASDFFILNLKEKKN